jgi:hypothetical protein
MQVTDIPFTISDLMAIFCRDCDIDINMINISLIISHFKKSPIPTTLVGTGGAGAISLFAGNFVIIRSVVVPLWAQLHRLRITLAETSQKVENFGNSTFGPQVNVSRPVILIQQ